jgi:hypothetical protein
MTDNQLFQDYIWRLVLCSSDDVASKAIELLKETFTNLGPRLQASQVILDSAVTFCQLAVLSRYKKSFGDKGL